jgi:hypothetical protein
MLTSRDDNSDTGTRYPPGTRSDGAGYGNDFLPAGGTRTETGTGQVFFLTRG